MAFPHRDLSQPASDPSLLLFDLDDDDGLETEVTTHLAPLPPINLPTFPGPTLSPTSSKLQLRGNSTASGGGGGNPTPPASPLKKEFGNTGLNKGKDDALEEDISRARQDRILRRNQASGSSTPTTSAIDPRDTASARDNIRALASRGAGAAASNGSSLASFMGGASKVPRYHRVGTGPTEAEEEETRKLEEEMAATRAKWGAATTTTAPPTSGGLSLASLMKAAAGESSTGPTASNVAQRWKPAEPTASPHKLKSNSAPVMTFGTANNVFSQQPITPPTVAQSTFKPTPALPSLVPTPAPKPVLAASPLPSPSVVAPAAPQWKPIAITPGGAAARRGVSPQRATTAPVRPVSPVKPLPTPQASPPLIPTANKPTSSSPAPIRRIATTAPPHPSSADNSKPTTPFRVSPISTPSSSTPRSLAAMFGSTASGPRLNSQAPQSHVEDDNSTGPQHARPGLGLGGVALPGMSAVPSGTVRARAQSFTNGGIKDVVNGATSTPLAPANLSTRPTPSPSVVDVAGAPEPEQQEDEDAEILSSPEIETAGTPEIEALHFSSTPTSPVVPSQHFEDENHHLVDQHSSASTTTTMPTYPTASLNRLQQSNIVAERLKWGEEQTKKDGLNEEGKIAPASPSKQRGNVLSRWGRDVPNVVETTSTTASPVVARSSPPTTAPSSPWGAQVGGKLAERWGEKKDVGDEGMEKSSPKTVETSPKVAEVEVQQKVESPKIESPQVPEPVAAATPVEEEQEKVVIPTTSPLVHLNRNRARPPKSTPRTSVVTTSTASSPSSIYSPAMTSTPSPTVATTSPLFSSSSSRVVPTISASAPSIEQNLTPLSPITLSIPPPSLPQPTIEVSAPPLSSSAVASPIEPAESPIAGHVLSRWSGVPIGVKQVGQSSTALKRSSAPPPARSAGPISIAPSNEPRHTRGVALPGMSAATAPSAKLPSVPVRRISNDEEAVESHKRRAQEEAQRAGRAGIGIGIFQRPAAEPTTTKDSAVDAALRRLDPASSKAPEPKPQETKRDSSDGPSRFTDPFRAPAMQVTQSNSSVASSHPSPVSEMVNPWTTSKSSKHNSYDSTQSSTKSVARDSQFNHRSLQLDAGSPRSVQETIASWGAPAPRSSTPADDIRESYGVRTRPDSTSTVASSTTVSSSQSSQPRAAPPKSVASSIAGRSLPPTPQLVEIPEFSVTPSDNDNDHAATASTTASMTRQSSAGSTSTAFTDAPDGLSSPADRHASIIALHRPSISEAVLLAKSPIISPRLPQGEATGLDVYSLVTNEADPIDHNHVFYQTEILAIVHRTEVKGRRLTVMYVWFGRDAKEGSATRARVDKIAKAYDTVPIEVRYRKEPRALVEIFGDQITICEGVREDFNHLDTKLYTIQSAEGVVFVEEVPLMAKHLCSGYCAVLSIVGEVYAWFGKGSSPLEREACYDFAETIADGRQVSSVKEGQETAYFWHGLDGTEYASAHYWRFRRTHPHHRVSVVQIDSTSSPLVTRIDSLELSTTCVSLIDGGFAEHWIIVPSAARKKRADLSIAIEAADELAGLWKEREFPFKQPYHVLCFPTLIPKDLPHLARQLDFDRLNAGETPTRMNVYTSEEAREKLL